MLKITSAVALAIIVSSSFVALPAFAAPRSVTQTVSGVASWYGPGFNGKKTASGVRFNENAMTAAHPSLAFGTVVRVINQNNGQTVEVTINDRGPFHGGRLIDLSKAAATKIGLVRTGTARVTVEVLD